MLIRVKTLKGYKLKGLDGELGKIKEFYFDDQHWAVRYLVADTGTWLNDRSVLISPYSLVALNIEERYIDIDLTKKQIEKSPSLDSDKPVSRQFELAYYGYYGMPLYWGGPFMWGSDSKLVRDREKWRKLNPDAKAWDPHLRSTYDVSGYNIQARDGEIGHVEDFIIDDTKNLWPGKKVLLSPQWIERISWDESKVFVNLSSDSIKQSPEYTEESLLTRDYETALHQHYNRRGYWFD
jgi:hypothetical protein